MTSVGSDEGPNLHALIRFAMRHYQTIVGMALVAMLVGVIVGVQKPVLYDAQALVVVVPPPYVAQFDPHFQSNAELPSTANLNPMAKSVATLATGDDVISALSTSVAGFAPDLADPVRLREALDVKTTSDGSLITLTASARSPEEAAKLVNAWAAAVVAQSRAVFGQGAGDVTYFEGKTTAASGDLAKAQAALSSFQSRSQLSVLNAQLQAMQADAQDYAADREAAARLTSDVRGLRQHLGQYAPNDPVPLGDDLTALLLETKAFNASSTTRTNTNPNSSSNSNTNPTITTTTSVPVQLQITDTSSLTGKKVSQVEAALDDFDKQLQARSAFDDARIADLTPKILQIQGQVQDIQNELDRLTAERDVAKETYLSLERETDQLRLTSPGSYGDVKLASKALPLGKTSNLTKLAIHTALYGAIGLVAGALAGLAVVFLGEWWRRERELVTKRPTVALGDGLDGGSG